jgi:hypothetical protein
LLANAVYQSADVLADPPHSRASPLPHFDCVPAIKNADAVEAVGV